MPVNVEFNGDELRDRLRRDTANAVDAVTRASARDAEASHTWVNRKGNLETKIRNRRANRASSVITGAFGYAYAKGRKGVRDGFYGLFHETGTTHEFARPTLRPAADRHFGDLVGEIRKRFKTRGVDL